MNELYCDGGVIERNPSPIGGTWAFRLLQNDEVVREKSGVVLPAQVKMETISNNLTEMAAMLKGLMALPNDWTGTVYSDSQVTLGRVFMGWKWNNIPPVMHGIYQRIYSRLIHWDQIRYVLLDGHPTKAQLAAGEGKRGHPVSEHNVWCDKACNEAAKRFLEGSL